MRRRERIKEKGDRRGIVLTITLLAIAIFFGWILLRASVVSKQGRVNLVVVSKETSTFVSIDPVEKSTMVIAYPATLSIRSRSQGEYQVGKLYALGAYDPEPGEFVRVKVQGFMKTLLLGYVVAEEDKEVSRRSLIRDLLLSKFGGVRATNLSFFDTVLLASRVVRYDLRKIGVDDLLRAGVITVEGEGYKYNEDRLQQYLGLRIFDWGVGKTGLTVAVINETQEPGLGADVSKFLENAGVDVVAVRTGELGRDKTEVTVKDETVRSALLPLWRGFGFESAKVGNTTEWRADVVIELGEDALKLF